MRYPQILVYERDSRLARFLENTSEAHGWSPHPPDAATNNLQRWPLREPRSSEACLRLLREGPGVLVLRLGAQLELELALLVHARRVRPETGMVVVGDVENPALADLAWDLGANYVLFPPQSRELLPAIVVHWMKSVNGRPAATGVQTDA